MCLCITVSEIEKIKIKNKSDYIWWVNNVENVKISDVFSKQTNLLLGISVQPCFLQGQII